MLQQKAHIILFVMLAFHVHRFNGIIDIIGVNLLVGDETVCDMFISFAIQVYYIVQVLLVESPLGQVGQHQAADGLPTPVRKRRVLANEEVGTLDGGQVDALLRKRRVAPATVTAPEVAGVLDDGLSVSDSTDVCSPSTGLSNGNALNYLYEPSVSHVSDKLVSKIPMGQLVDIGKLPEEDGVDR